MSGLPGLKALIRKHDLKQFEVAAEMGISESHLSLLISGAREPSRRVLDAALDVARRHDSSASYATLLTENPEPATEKVSA